MRLSLVFLNAARRGAAFFVAVEAKTKVPLPSPNGSVDQRKSRSWHARIGSLAQRQQFAVWVADSERRSGHGAKRTFAKS
jgi:hypothetical protein